MILRAAPIVTEGELLESQDVAPNPPGQPIGCRAANAAAADDDNLVRVSHFGVVPFPLLISYGIRLRCHRATWRCPGELAALPLTRGGSRSDTRIRVVLLG